MTVGTAKIILFHKLCPPGKYTPLIMNNPGSVKCNGARIPGDTKYDSITRFFQPKGPITFQQTVSASPPAFPVLAPNSRLKQMRAGAAGPPATQLRPVRRRACEYGTGGRVYGGTDCVPECGDIPRVSAAAGRHRVAAADALCRAVALTFSRSLDCAHVHCVATWHLRRNF